MTCDGCGFTKEESEQWSALRRKFKEESENNARLSSTSSSPTNMEDTHTFVLVDVGNEDDSLRRAASPSSPSRGSTSRRYRSWRLRWIQEYIYNRSNLLKAIREHARGDGDVPRICAACLERLSNELTSEINDCRCVLRSYETMQLENIKSYNRIERKRMLRSRARDCQDERTSTIYPPHASRTRLSRCLRNEVWKSFRELSDSYRCLTTDRDTLLRRIDAVDQEMKRVRSFNAVHDACLVWQDGHFGTVSGLRLGSLPPSERVSAVEINAACGQMAVLINVLAERLGVQFPRYRIVDSGSTSFVLDGQRQSALERTSTQSSSTTFHHVERKYNFHLGHSVDDASFGNDEDISSFNRASRIICECVGMLSERLCRRRRRGHDSTRQVNATIDRLNVGRLPYTISNGRVGDCAVTIPTGVSRVPFERGVREWTKAMRHLLTDLKFLQAQVFLS